MPKVSNKIDYSKTQISFYKFVCKTDNVVNCYVGSTANFRQRKNKHKTTCNNANDPQHNTLIYQTMRENGGWENWTMVEIANKLCASKRDAERQEQEYMNELKPSMNSIKAFNTEDDITERKRQWYAENADKVAEQHKQYRAENADKIKDYLTENADKIKEKRKQYYIARKDKIKEQKKQYSAEKADKIKEYKRLYYIAKKEKIKSTQTN